MAGAMTARALASYCLSVCILEKGNDVALGASRANSGIVHAGYDAREGTLKARLNVRGSEIMEPLAREYGAAYLDYSHDPDFACRHEYYRDMSHMNLEGAEAFCRQFYAGLETPAGF